MSSKPKNVKTYIVHHRGKAHHGGYTILGRYIVGAKNEKEAEKFLRETIGKHAKVKVYYEDTKKTLSYGMVILDK